MTERPEDIHRPAAAEAAQSAPAATPSAESGAEDIVWEGDAAALDTPALTRLLTRRAAAPEDVAMPAGDGDAEDDAEDGDETEDAEDDDAAETASGDAPTADAPSEDASPGRPQRSRRPRHEQGDPGWVRLEAGEAEDDGADGDDAAEDDPDDAPAAQADAPEPTAAAPEATDGPAPTARPLSRHPQLRTGRGAILAALKTMPDSPGVYRMLDGHGDVLYVGKAKHLKRRVAS